MSISASHWGGVVARVQAHTRSLHPNNPKKAERLARELLGIITEEDVQEMRDRVTTRLAEATPTKSSWWKFRWLFG